jgi:hypothetical protein
MDLAGRKGYVTNLITCPDGTQVTGGLRHRLLPPALEHREEPLHVKARPAGTGDPLPPDLRDALALVR